MGRARRAARRGSTEYEAAKYPWFNYSNGSGFYHSDAVWAERLDIPFSFLRGYIRSVAGG